jgi:hypothetical protein
VLALNFRAAMAQAATSAFEHELEYEETEADVARKHIEGMARARKYGDLLRSVYG